MKKIIISGIVVAILLLNMSPKQYTVVEPVVLQIEDKQQQNLALYISNKYDIHKAQATNIVETAYKHSNELKFPTPIDTLAIIAIESAYKVKAVSTSGAKGLMQILYKPTSFSVEENIKDGVKLLKDYIKITKGNVSAAVQSYNVGIGAYTQMEVRNEDYYFKYKKAKKELESI